jgi:hypothetical protein
MSTVLSVIAFATAFAGAVMWVVSTLQHRSHLSHCADAIVRHRRLCKRLIGCVVEMEQILDRTAPQSAPGIPVVPEELVGHARFLSGLRQEAEDHSVDLGRHAARLRWPDGYLAKRPLARMRCEIAHGALVTSFQLLADATRDYERGLTAALFSSGDGADARAMSMPLRLLDEAAASEVARLRQACRQELTHAADACKLRFETSAVFDVRWPAWRSEVTSREADPYEGEVRPLGWQGFGAQPLLHVDAK